MPTSRGSVTPFVTISRSADLYNTVSYPVGGNVTTSTGAIFTASYASGTNIIYVTYVTSGKLVPGMSLYGLGIPNGTNIVGPLSQNGTGSGGIGSYTISLNTTLQSAGWNGSANAITGYNSAITLGNAITASASTLSPSGPGGIVGPVPGFNCVNIMELRNYYKIPYPPIQQTASPPVIGIVSFGGGIYGQPVTTGQYAGFWRCTDINGASGTAVNVLVNPINGAINAPNADDGGATLENTVDVATVNAFYGMLDPSYNAPTYTPPIIILYIAPSSDISEMYRTFYTVLKNPVVCNGRSYLPSIVSCSWGAPETAWTQKMAFPPNPSIPIDNSPNPEGIAELNEINDLFAEAIKNGINICCASGDIPLTTVNASVNTYNYAQSLLLQAAGSNGYPTGQTPASQVSVFPLTDAARASLPPPQVTFPSSSPYVTCVGGSAVYFPSINSGSYDNAAEFAWARGNGGISSVFSIPAYQQNLPGSASVSASQFLATSLNTANLAADALGTPSPTKDPISNAYTAPNTGVTLAAQIKNNVYNNTLAIFNSAQADLNSAQSNSTNDVLLNSLVQVVKDASTALATAESNKKMAYESLEAAKDLVVKTQSVSSLLLNVGKVFGALAESTGAFTGGAAQGAAYASQQALLTAKYNAQTAAYTQSVTPTTANLLALDTANKALQAAQAAADASELAAMTLPNAVQQSTDIANDAVSQGAAAIVAPSLSSHPYLDEHPKSSPVIKNLVDLYNLIKTVNLQLPYDPSLTAASSYLLSAIGTGYKIPNIGTVTGTVRSDLDSIVTESDKLVVALGDGITGDLANLINSLIKSSVGQLDSSGTYFNAANAWSVRADISQMIPEAGSGYGSSTATSFPARSINLAQLPAITISSYSSGANANGSGLGFSLPCGLASTAASVLAAIYHVTNDELDADKAASYPFGTTDVLGGTVALGSYNGITTSLINLRNIYVNTLLASKRTTTARNAAHKAKEAFLAWSSANDSVNSIESDATNLYNRVPTPPNEYIIAMNDKLLAAKVLLSSRTYDLAIAENYAVTTARLAQQSAASASVFMGNKIMKTFDQLGNINSVPYDDIFTYQGANNANCPLITRFVDSSDSSGTSHERNNALKAAQALIQAAANDNYLSSSVVTTNVHTLSGVDSSGAYTSTFTGARMLVQDAQFAAAGVSGKLATIAFNDATESLARFTDWQNIALIANQAVEATSLIYAALQDASSNTMINDSSGNSPLVQAVNAAIITVKLVVAAITPYNQQATVSATIATNNVVVTAAKLESLKNVCMAAQAAIELAASTYNASVSTSISGTANSQGGSIFTINMAYAKVTADAAAAAATAAAIVAREEAILAAIRANYSAIALQKIVGTATIDNAIAGFLDASGNLVSQTGYDNAYPLPGTLGGSGIVNGIVPPAVSKSTVLYQGCGGLEYVAGGIGTLNSQPSIITNLTYTTNTSTSVYAAVARLVTTCQNVINILEVDSSSNTQLRSYTSNDYLSYPNVNAINALNTTLYDSSGTALSYFQSALLAAYEAQQWVVASANATFVTFGPSAANVKLVSFTPSLIGVINKLESDADACLETMLTAEAAILYAMSQRPNPVAYHDVDAANFATAFISNQSITDTHLELKNSAILLQKSTIKSLHLGDLANALSPLLAGVTISANQAAALGGMRFSSPTPNSNILSNSSLSNANFPPGGWGSVSQPTIGYNLSSQVLNSTNPNPGPYNGRTTGTAPFPADNASSSSRPSAPSATILNESVMLLSKQLSDITLAFSSTLSNALDLSLKFNDHLAKVSTVTASLVDSATSAADKTLLAAQTANFAINPSVNNPSNTSIFTPSSSSIGKLLEKEFNLILQATASAKAKLEATSPNNQRYNSRKNMVKLWNKAVVAAQAVIQAVVDAPTYYPDYKGDPELIVPASLGNIAIMGKTNAIDPTPNNTAPIWNPTIVDASNNPVSYTTDTYYTSTPAEASVLKPSLLSLLNAAVIDAYNATTGSPDSSGTYRYIAFYLTDSSSNVVGNYPETLEDAVNAIAVLNANSQLVNVTAAAVIAAQVAIQAAYNTASAATAAATQPTLIPTPVGISAPNGGSNSISFTAEEVTIVQTAVNAVVQGTGSTVFSAGNQTGVVLANKVAQELWNEALILCNTMCQKSEDGTYPNISLDTLFQLMSIVGLNLSMVEGSSSITAGQANVTNLQNTNLIKIWAKASSATGTWNPYLPTINLSPSTSQGAFNGGYAYTNTYTFTEDWLDIGVHAPISLMSINSTPITIGRWSAFYWTAAISDPGSDAYQAAYAAWNAVLVAVNSFASQPTSTSSLQTNAEKANITQAESIYSIKRALRSAAKANESAIESLKSISVLATSTHSFEDLAAAAVTEAVNASTSNLNFYRCTPDIAMHADADDLPVIFKLNGGEVYVGGTSIAAAMFAGYLGVVQSHNPINYFVNPILYDNYTFPSPLFNDISGSLQVWYSDSSGSSSVPPRIANILPGVKNPQSGLGSGIYNCNVGLGSINGINLATLMEIPELVTRVSPRDSDNQTVTVYPGSSVTITAYVEPINAFNPNVTWSTTSQNITITPTTKLSNNGINDTIPYTPYNPLLADSSGNQQADLTIGNYSIGSVGNFAVGTNPYHLDSNNKEIDCLIFTATVTGITQVYSGSPLPVITMTSSDGSSVFGSYKVNVLPPIQVIGVSISSLNETQNPSNVRLFLGTTLQLVANVTPVNATNQQVYWWSSNTAIVNIDVNGLMTPLASGQVTIKVTTINNNISASINVYVPVPITGISVLPSTITLNPNISAYPVKNTGIINVVIQPENADYKFLKWEIISTAQDDPAPTGIRDVISIPTNGNILSTNSSGQIIDNSQITLTALSNGTAVIKVSTQDGPYDVYGSYSSTISVNVITPVTNISMTESNMVINLSPESASGTVLPESYKVTATFKPAYPSNMNVFWTSSNPRVAVVSNNSKPVLNTTTSDPNFGLWQITEIVTPLSNGTTVIKVTTADGQKTDSTTVVVTTPVTGLSMSALPIILNPSRTYTLQATVLPATATNKLVTWSTTNTSIATVDSNGVVKAITSGSCGITATTADGDYSAISEISVVTNLVGVQLVVNSRLPIHVNEVVQILVVMIPTTSTNQQFTWTVSSGVFTQGLPQNGNIVYLDAVQAGSAVFTVTTADGNKQASVSLVVVN